MMRSRGRIWMVCAALGATLRLAAQEPLYIVNGEVRDEITNIPPELIVKTERLPADEVTIGRYGPRAANGVLIITLRHDRPARFTGEGGFDEYLAARVAWPAEERAARVVVRYTVTCDGRAVAERVLESTDRRLMRRVLKAMAEAPALWEPATREGRPVESRGVVRVQLPEGKPMPREVEVVYR